MELNQNNKTKLKILPRQTNLQNKIPKNMKKERANEIAAENNFDSEEIKMLK